MTRISIPPILLVVFQLGIARGLMAQQESLGDLSKRVRAEKEQKERQDKSIDL